MRPQLKAGLGPALSSLWGCVPFVVTALSGVALRQAGPAGPIIGRGSDWATADKPVHMVPGAESDFLSPVLFSIMGAGVLTDAEVAE